jgi:hypothetical protein
MKDPEFKKMMGHRQMDSDGFTYVYGSIKDGSKVNHTGNRASVKRARRNDKRSVKQKAIQRIMNEEFSLI